MAFAAAIAPIISGIAGIAAAGAQASALNQAADDEERIAQWNADRDKEQAAYAQSQGALESRKRKEEAEKAAARARAARAQGGVATDTGTALLLEQDFAAESSFSQRVEMYNANRQKAEHLNEAKIGIYEGKVRADAKRSQAKAAMVSGFAGAAKSFAGAFG